jgi:predicted transcriptional regulator of viral defense system
MSDPHTFVGREKLAKNAKLSINQIRKWTDGLGKSGWITRIRRGCNESNDYILHAKREKRRNH